MKKIMIVGTGFGQLPLIDACKRKGYYSIGIDFNPDSTGASLVDKFFNVDVKDIDKVLQIAKSEKIDAVVTMQSDLPVPTIGMINQELNLTGVNYKTSIVCSNKDQTRKALKEKNVTQPNFSIVHTLDEALNASVEIGYPCIIKSPDSSGSRGVSKVRQKDDVSEAFQEACHYSRSGEILVEEFIDGIEIGAQTFSQDSECLYSLIHNDTLCENGFMVPTGHSYPFNQISIDEEKVKDSIDKALKAVGLTNGPANVDLIVTLQGDVHIIEIGARIGATCLPELTSIYTGLEWEDIVINNALGLKHKVTPIKARPCAAFVLESPKDGTLKAINKHFLEHDYSQYNPTIEITVELGDKVSKLRKGTDRIGRVVVDAESVEEAEFIAKELRDKVEFIIETNE